MSLRSYPKCGIYFIRDFFFFLCVSVRGVTFFKFSSCNETKQKDVQIKTSVGWGAGGNMEIISVRRTIYFSKWTNFYWQKLKWWVLAAVFTYVFFICIWQGDGFDLDQDPVLTHRGLNLHLLSASPPPPPPGQIMQIHRLLPVPPPPHQLTSPSPPCQRHTDVACVCIRCETLVLLLCSKAHNVWSLCHSFTVRLFRSNHHLGEKTSRKIRLVYTNMLRNNLIHCVGRQTQVRLRLQVDVNVSYETDWESKPNPQSQHLN